MKSIIAATFLGLLLAGCASTNGDFNWVTHTWTSNQGTYALDHVSRNRVDVSKAVRRQYLGETYYFETEANAKVFDGNPWAYLYSDNTRSPRPDRSDWN
jgi:YHS domain-containing protein